MAGFLLFCAAWSLVVLKKRSALASQVQGMTRLLAVTGVLFAVTSVQYALFMTEHQTIALFEGYFLPEWLTFGVDRLILHLAQTSCILYIALMASKQFYRSRPPTSTLSTKLLSEEESEEGSGRLQEAIPLAYQV